MPNTAGEKQTNLLVSLAPYRLRYPLQPHILEMESYQFVVELNYYC